MLYTNTIFLLHSQLQAKSKKKEMIQFAHISKKKKANVASLLLSDKIQFRGKNVTCVKEGHCH